MSTTSIDTNLFAEMKELMEDSFEDIIQMSLQTLPQQLIDIKSAIEKTDVEKLFNVSHKMKSSCGSIGASGLAEKAQAIELISRQGSADIPEEMYNELLNATHEVIDYLKSEVGT